MSTWIRTGIVGWRVEFLAIAPQVSGTVAAKLRDEGVIVEDLRSLMTGL